MSSPSSSKILSSRKQHKKAFNGLILFGALEKLLSNHLIGVDSFKSSSTWKNAGFSWEKFLFLQNFMQQGQRLHHSCPPQRGRWMPMAPLSSSFFTWSLQFTYFTNPNVRDGLFVTYLKHRQKVLAFTEHAEKTPDGDYSLWTWEYWWHFQLYPALKVRRES